MGAAFSALCKLFTSPPTLQRELGSSQYVHHLGKTAAVAHRSTSPQVLGESTASGLLFPCMKPPCPRLGDLGGEDLSNDRSKDLCVHGSPKEREQEVGRVLDVLLRSKS